MPTTPDFALSWEVTNKAIDEQVASEIYYFQWLGNNELRQAEVEHTAPWHIPSNVLMTSCTRLQPRKKIS